MGGGARSAKGRDSGEEFSVKGMAELSTAYQPLD